MDLLQVAPLNVNDGTHGVKRTMLTDCIKQKHLHVVVLQETHSDVNNEVDCGLL